MTTIIQLRKLPNQRHVHVQIALASIAAVQTVIIAVRNKQLYSFKKAPLTIYVKGASYIYLENDLTF